jgi:hypothetical protein
MKASPIQKHIRVTRSPTSLADYCRVEVDTVYNWFNSGEIPNKYAKYIIEWIEINNDKGLEVCDELLKIIKLKKV